MGTPARWNWSLSESDDRFLLAINSDGVPAELPALAPLLGLMLLADAESLFAGTFREKLVGN